MCGLSGSTSKRRISELAIFGGQPAFEQPLHVGRPNIGNRTGFMARVNGLLDRAWLTNNGPLVQQFEQELARFVGTRHMIAVCNATSGLEIAARVAELSGEVIVPSFTFIATAHALHWLGIQPVFADIEPETHNLDPDSVERLITPRTSAILGVHVWGRPCRIEALNRIAQRHRLKLLFDAAHAFGCSHRGTKIGSFGIAEVFSFHATKFFNTFEGGAIATNDDDFAARCRLARNFGFAGHDRVVHLGINAKLGEVAAAMGLTNLESVEDFIACNRQNYSSYREVLSDLPGLQILQYDETEACSYHYVVLEIDSAVSRIARDDLLRVLEAENVLARRYFYPGCHRMEPYHSLWPEAASHLPETERLVKRVMLLPTGTSLNEPAVRGIGEIIRCAVKHGEEISARLTFCRGTGRDKKSD